MKSHHHLGYLMDSLEKILNCWGLWKTTGQIHSQKPPAHLIDKVQTSGRQSIALYVDDSRLRRFEDLINRHLTRKQKDAIYIEYRASPNVPHLQTSEQRGNLIQITGKTYRERLRTAKTALSAYMNY
ncbi:TPA: hypothetical protein NJ263_003871 [Vibrio parahaemolyticus]|uniref:hypothetical protein n=1 Tax=Vibrio parahaemolyticus TaxID=670 RepID=UPI00235F1220|nr:hypothetical protein [Vibrio parahaemolyticus]EJG0884002.1 hypothetical protein [Vibrio parahaemolyticus]HCG6790337.1 hypothetical protein [Vibrio parahaemolyticus]HCH3852171.1 hypothetical protein [Vibrio parahaemolyticus]